MGPIKFTLHSSYIYLPEHLSLLHGYFNHCRCVSGFGSPSCVVMLQFCDKAESDILTLYIYIYNGQTLEIIWKGLPLFPLQLSMTHQIMLFASCPPPGHWLRMVTYLHIFPTFFFYYNKPLFHQDYQQKLQDILSGCNSASCGGAHMHPEVFCAVTSNLWNV